MPSSVRVHALISGRVQGVFFRESTRAKAMELGATGWVRNLADGRVELVAEGPKPAVEALLSWCRVGPPAARVEGVSRTNERATHEFASFRVIR